MKTNELTHEEMITIIDCVAEEHLRVLTEMGNSPFELQDKLSENDVGMQLKTDDDIKSLNDYLRNKELLIRRSEYLQGIINKLSRLCESNDTDGEADKGEHN